MSYYLTFNSVLGHFDTIVLFPGDHSSLTLLTHICHRKFPIPTCIERSWYEFSRTTFEFDTIMHRKCSMCTTYLGKHYCDDVCFQVGLIETGNGIHQQGILNLQAQLNLGSSLNATTHTNPEWVFLIN